MTLLEQLVSIVLCAIIMLAATTSYKVLLQNGSVLKEHYTREDSLRNVLDRVADDVSCLFVDKNLCAVQTRRFRDVTGNEILMQFCSSAAPQGIKESAIEEVRYVLQKKSGENGGSSATLFRLSRPAFVRLEREWQAMQLATDVTGFQLEQEKDSSLGTIYVTVGEKPSVKGSLVFTLPMKSDS